MKKRTPKPAQAVMPSAAKSSNDSTASEYDMSHLPEDPLAMLARIDERTKLMLEQMEDFVTQAEFGPVQRLTYGFAALLLTLVIGAIVAAAI